jgi:hypothetical protein
MHPLMPNTITLVIRFLDPDAQKFANQDSRERMEVRDALVRALKSLAEVNNLAREQVCGITADPVLARSTPPEFEITQLMSRSSLAAQMLMRLN